MTIYTGIGSRQTPEEILVHMEDMAKLFAELGFILRSGGADGADSAFEKGFDDYHDNGPCLGKKEIYIPWHGFNKRYVNDRTFFEPLAGAARIAKEFHPNWDACTQGAKKLHARNTHQILGYDLKTPSDFVVCWTGPTGGTNQALRIARHYKVPIFNLKDELLTGEQILERLKNE